MVPLDRIPLTRNGKLDRAALPDPAAGRAARPPDRRARTATERTLARLLADLLKTSPETIGVHDNLFDLGGDSLMVTQFHSRVVEEFDVDLPVRRVYQALDIAALATTVEDFRARADRQAILSALAEVEALPPEPSGPPVWEGSRAPSDSASWRCGVRASGCGGVPRRRGRRRQRLVGTAVRTARAGGGCAPSGSVPGPRRVRASVRGGMPRRRDRRRYRPVGTAGRMARTGGGRAPGGPASWRCGVRASGCGGVPRRRGRRRSGWSVRPYALSAPEGAAPQLTPPRGPVEPAFPGGPAAAGTGGKRCRPHCPHCPHRPHRRGAVPRVTPPRSIVETARRHAALTPDRPAYAFLPDGEEESVRFGFAGIDARARAVAAVLQDRGLTGERVLIAYPSGPAYVQGFLGCLYAGAVAVPCDEPRPGPGAERLAAIRADARPALALAAPAPGTDGPLGGLPTLDVTGIPDSAAAHWTDPAPAARDLAFLQYTSGSTRQPRGVMVDHGNLLANERSIEAACGHDRDSTFVGWLPLFHDMGLVANLLQPLHLGSLSVLMPPMAFLQRPGRWLRAVSRYRAHTSGGPDFAYDLCVRRVTAAEREELDLAHWLVAYNGAEPVRADTMRRFAESFAPHGFDPAAHFPSYGLAEATLLVAAGPKKRPPRVLAADRAALRRGRVRPATGDDAATALVGHGTAGVDTEVLVVDPDTRRPLPDGHVGELWVRGGEWPAATGAARGVPARAGRPPQRPRKRPRRRPLPAYRRPRRPARRRAVPHRPPQGPDRRPRPEPLPARPRTHRGGGPPALRVTCCAAFSVEDDGEERLVLCCELNSYRPAPDLPAIAETVRAALARRHGIALHTLVVLRRGGIAKTTSGKVRRQYCRTAYLDGTLRVHGQVRPTATEDGPELPRTTDPVRLATALRDLAAARAGRDTPAGPRRTRRGPRPGLLAALHVHHRVQAVYGVTLPATALLGDATFLHLAELTLAARATPQPARPREPAPEAAAGCP
ncbi:AMP-binding protein [Streptomyces stramineus]